MGRRVSSPAFIGRTQELGFLEAALGQASSGTPAVVLVGGEAGVGKTRLTSQFAARAAQAGARVLAGGCVPVGEGSLAYAPVVEALRGLLGELGVTAMRALVGPGWPELARLLPALGEQDEPGQVAEQGESAQARLFEVLLGLLAQLGEQAPVVLVVEDLHWADQSTRDLLAFLVRNLRRERVVLLVTFRSDELAQQQLGTFLAELDRGGRVERWELVRFDRTEVAAQVAAILDREPAAGLVAGIFARSQGNPFFTEELLTTAHADDGELPATLRDLLRGRVEAVSGPAQQLLRVAAVAGRRVSHRLLAAVAGLDDEPLTQALRELVAHQLLVVGPGRDGYDFRHALLRETIEADLLPGERAGLHASYARVLTERPELADGSPAVAAAELAAHWLAAGDWTRALPALVVAGQTAEQAKAFPEAHRLYEQALGLWELVVDPEGCVGWTGSGCLGARPRRPDWPGGSSGPSPWPARGWSVWIGPVIRCGRRGCCCWSASIIGAPGTSRPVWPPTTRPSGCCPTSRRPSGPGRSPSTPRA